MSFADIAVEMVLNIRGSREPSYYGGSASCLIVSLPRTAKADKVHVFLKVGTVPVEKT